EWREANREGAKGGVIRTQVLSEFARREGISVDEEEIDKEVGTILERFEGDEREQAQKVLGEHEARHDLEDRLFQQKIVERLAGIAEGKIEAAAAPPADEGRKTIDEGESPVSATD